MPAFLVNSYASKLQTGVKTDKHCLDQYYFLNIHVLRMLYWITFFSMSFLLKYMSWVLYVNSLWKLYIKFKLKLLIIHIIITETIWHNWTEIFSLLVMNQTNLHLYLLRIYCNISDEFKVNIKQHYCFRALLLESSAGDCEVKPPLCLPAFSESLWRFLTGAVVPSISGIPMVTWK
jgi:hypothetical protein